MELSYIEWFGICVLLIVIMSNKVFANFVMLAMWPVRLPVLAVLYVLLLFMYVLIRIFDPRCVDYVFIRMSEAGELSHPLTRWFKSLKGTLKFRKNQTFDLMGYRAKKLSGAVTNANKQYSGTGSINDRIDDLIADEVALSKTQMKNLEVKLKKAP